MGRRGVFDQGDAQNRCTGADISDVLVQVNQKNLLTISDISHALELVFLARRHLECNSSIPFLNARSLAQNIFYSFYEIPFYNM